MDREQARNSQQGAGPHDQGCANMRRKAVVAAVVFNEKLIALCAAQSLLQGITGGAGGGGGEELLREERGMGGAAAEAAREEDWRRRRDMMAIGQAMSEQVEELLTDLQLACTVAPSPGAGGADVEQHHETVGVVRDFAIELRGALGRLLELDSISADWAHVARLAAKIGAVATRAEQALFLFDERLRFQTQRRLQGGGGGGGGGGGSGGGVYGLRRGGQGAKQNRDGFRALHADSLPKALKGKRHGGSGGGGGGAGNSSSSSSSRASGGVPQGKDGKPKFKSRIDLYFQLINPEVLYADREKQRFGRMTRRQRENAALRSMTALSTAGAGAGGGQGGNAHGSGALKGAGRMNAASERVMRTFITDMTNTYDQKTNVSDFLGPGQGAAKSQDQKTTF